MYNSIQHFLDFGTGKIEKRLKISLMVDRLVGINPHDRMSADVVINALEEARE